MHFIKYMSAGTGLGITQRLWDEAFYLFDFNQTQSGENNNYMWDVRNYAQVGTYPGALHLDHLGYDNTFKGPFKLVSTEDHYYAECGNDGTRLYAYTAQRPYNAFANYYIGELVQGAHVGHDSYTFGGKLVWDSSQTGVGNKYLFEHHETGGSPTWGVRVYKNSSDQIVWTMLDTNGTYQTCTTTSAIAFDQSIVLAFQYDPIPANPTMKIFYSVTGTGVTTEIGSHTCTYNAANIPASDGTAMYLGARFGGTYGIDHMEGKLDQWWAFGIELTSAEIAHLANAWDISEDYYKETGHYWHPGDVPTELHIDMSWAPTPFERNGSGGGSPQWYNPAHGWTNTVNDDIDAFVNRSGNFSLMPGALFGVNPKPQLKLDSTSGRNYVELRNTHGNYIAHTSRSFTRDGQVTGFGDIGWKTVTHMFVARARTGQGSGCFFTTFNDFADVGPNARYQVWTNESDVWMKEANTSEATVTASNVMSTTDFDVFMVVQDDEDVYIYANDPTTPVASATGLFLSTPQTNNDTLTPILFASGYDYNYETVTNNPWGHDLAEYAYWHRPLDLSERVRVFNDMKTKWNIS